MKNFQFSIWRTDQHIQWLLINAARSMLGVGMTMVNAQKDLKLQKSWSLASRQPLNKQEFSFKRMTFESNNWSQLQIETS
jgi:hypothetical protein